MSSPEWIEPHAAVYQLAAKWNIPHSAAEEIIKGVLCGGRCYVRGVSKEIAAALSSLYSPHVLIPWGFTDVGIDWDHLLEHGRPLVPEMWEYFVAAAEAPVAPKRRPSPAETRRFTGNYIANEKNAGRIPTELGLETAARAANFGAPRETLRDFFKQQQGILKRGRPAK